MKKIEADIKGQNICKRFLFVKPNNKKEREVLF